MEKRSEKTDNLILGASPVEARENFLKVFSFGAKKAQLRLRGAL